MDQIESHVYDIVDSRKLQTSGSKQTFKTPFGDAEITKGGIAFWDMDAKKHEWTASQYDLKRMESAVKLAMARQHMKLLESRFTPKAK